MHRFARILCLAPALAVALHATALAQGAHVDKRSGFQVRPPAGWSKIPIKVEEKWIAAKWLSDKKYIDKESGFEHQPMMKVIVFDKAKAKGPEGGKTESGGGEDGPREVKPGDSLDLTAPYLDYKDYLKRNFQEGGFYISAEQATKVGDVPLLILEVKVEKLVMTGKKRIMAWELTADWGTIAIEVDCLEQHFDKCKPLFLGAFKTFGLIARDPNAKPDEEIESGAKLRVVDPNETPEQQKKRRMEAQEKAFKKAVADLPAGWTNKRTPHFLILNHGSPKYMEKVVAHAEAVRAWLDANFDDVGSGYVQHMIVRICKDRDEENAFRRSSGDAYSSQTREACVSENRDGTSAFEFEYLGTSIMQRWFSDKNDDLYSSMPQWLDRGLSQYVGTAVLKGNKLDFAPDSFESERIRDGRRLNKFKPVKELFEATMKDLWSGEDGRYLDAQIASLFRYIYGPGRANRKVGNLVKDYIKFLLEIVVENEKAARAAIKSAGDPKTEEEEEEEFRKRKKEDWSAKEKDFLKQVNKKVFGDWTDADWAALQAGWEKFAK